MDRELLNIFRNCVDNNESYYRKFITKSGDALLVVKYNWIPKFKITHLDKTCKQIRNIYDDLYAFDCFNMIEELMVY